MKKFNLVKSSNDSFFSRDERGEIFGYNSIEEFKTKRFFIINCIKGQWRGKHYHKKVTQKLFLISGEIEIRVKSLDGNLVEETMQRGDYYTQHPGQQFEFCSLSEVSTLLVLCDLEHDKNDYFSL